MCKTGKACWTLPVSELTNYSGKWLTLQALSNAAHVLSCALGYALACKLHNLNLLFLIGYLDIKHINYDLFA